MVDDGAGTNTLTLSASNFEKFGANWEHAVLPEDDGGSTLLAVNSDADGFEDFLVSEDGDLQQRFNINVDGVGTDHGIFLEISTST